MKIPINKREYIRLNESEPVSAIQVLIFQASLSLHYKHKSRSYVCGNNRCSSFAIIGKGQVDLVLN
jgi:hypothetical protein